MSVYLAADEGRRLPWAGRTAMHRTKSKDPTDRMGVYKRFEDVPDHHRLERYAERYEGQNVWASFCEEYEYQQGSSEHFRRAVDRAGDHWLTHMSTRGRHHALATPADVEVWCAGLTAEKSLSTAYNYWVRIRRFYDWLQWHVDHPHVYNPVLMAVVDGGAAGLIWEQKLRKWCDARARYTQTDE